MVERTPQRQAPARRERIFTPGTRFEYDESRRPEHMAYQWKRVTLAGQEDPENLILAEQNGWTPVPAERHPELAGRMAREGSAIVRGGQMLMEQPKEWQAEAQEMEKFAARNVVEQNIQRLGMQSRQNGARAKISRAVEPIGEEIG